MTDLASSGRAVTRAQFLTHFANYPSAPAELLRSMLDSCRSHAELMTWNEDYRAHHHLLTDSERVTLIRRSAPHFFRVMGRRMSDHRPLQISAFSSLVAIAGGE